jgi:hypothetical protein
MKIVRVEMAVMSNGRTDLNRKVCILCGIDDSLRICGGPSYGHEWHERLSYPFMMRTGDEISWGSDYPDEFTNIGKKTIQVDELVTIGEGPETNESWAERTFKVISVQAVR